MRFGGKISDSEKAKRKKLNVICRGSDYIESGQIFWLNAEQRKTANEQRECVDTFWSVGGE